VFHRPLEDLVRQNGVASVEGLQFDHRDDALRHAVSVDRVSAVVKIPGCAVLPEEVIAIKIESIPKAQFEFIGVRVLSNRA
jgi:Ni,Fe-hydrogenase III small subunit